jgi:hypothetical protein
VPGMIIGGEPNRERYETALVERRSDLSDLSPIIHG